MEGKNERGWCVSGCVWCLQRERGKKAFVRMSSGWGLTRQARPARAQARKEWNVQCETRSYLTAAHLTAQLPTHAPEHCKLEM